MNAEDDARFREFARANALHLRRTAYLLCADWHFAEDLVQTTLVKLYRVWPKFYRGQPIDNYTRRVLLRCWLDEQRWPWRRRERRDGIVPEESDDRLDPANAALTSGVSDPLLSALSALAPRQRATVVLRYCADLSVAEVAATLRCSEGTVRSQAARGLDTLRAVVNQRETAIERGR